MSTDLAAFKERQRRLWAGGDYSLTARRFEGVAAGLVAACRVGPGQRALDVAAGTGNVALAIAAAGASPEACDLTPELVAAGRERCDALGEWEIAWAVADAEQLPYADGRFDAVLSVFGLVFAPRPQVAIAEAFRVTCSRGTVGLTSWTPRSAAARIGEIAGRYLPAPAGSPPPAPHLWGDEATARERLAPHAAQVRFERATVRWSWPSAAAAREESEQHPFAAAARATLAPQRYRALLDELEELTRSLNTATDGGVSYDDEYARIVARKFG